MPRLFLIQTAAVAGTLVVVAIPASAPEAQVAAPGGPAQAVSLADQSGAWSLYTHLADPKEICFASSRPAESLPAGANRAAIYFYVSAWPKDGVKSEVSIKLGYPIKKDGGPVLIIGEDRFPLAAREDRAFIADPTDELKAIEAMKKGTTMIVQATSERGTATIDTYSLSGVSQTLQKLAATCP